MVTTVEALPYAEFQAWLTATAEAAADPVARLADMDTDGIDVQVIYGSLGLGLTSLEDKDFAVAMTRACNDYYARFCGEAPDLARSLAVEGSWGKEQYRKALAFAEPVSGLQARFRKVEVITRDDGGLPASLPSNWLNVERSGRTVRFADSAYTETVSESRIRSAFPDSRFDILPMSLRETFLALARTYQLWGASREALR